MFNEIIIMIFFFLSWLLLLLFLMPYYKIVLFRKRYKESVILQQFFLYLPELVAVTTRLAYPVWAYYVLGRQRRCQEDPVSLPSGRLEKTTRSSPHHVAQHCPTGSETTPPYSPRSSRFGSEPLSMEDDVDVWCYAILELHARNDDDDHKISSESFGRAGTICTNY